MEAWLGLTRGQSRVGGSNQGRGQGGVEQIQGGGAGAWRVVVSDRGVAREGGAGSRMGVVSHRERRGQRWVGLDVWLEWVGLMGGGGAEWEKLLRGVARAELVPGGAW